MNTKKTVYYVLLFLACNCSLYGQKKPLDHSVYDSWQHIGERMISNDGKWVVYTVDPQEGDNVLVIQSADTLYKRMVPRGYNAVITDDSRFVVFRIKPYYKDTREARIKKKKADDFPKDSLAVIELGKEAVWKKERVRNFKMPSRTSGWVAYQVEKPEPAAKPKTNAVNPVKRVTDSLTRIIDSLQQVIQTVPAKRGNRDEPDDGLQPGEYLDADGDDAAAAPAEQGYDLVLRNLVSGEEVTFNKALEYYFSKAGNKLLVERAKDPLDSNSQHAVVLYDLATAAFKLLSNGGNDFKNFTMQDDGSQMAWLAERDARPKDLQKFYRVWYYREGMDSAVLLADKNSVDMKLGMTVSEFGNLNFSKNGKRLFFGVSPIQPPKDTTIIEMDKPKLDIWHYKDDYLQTVQTNPGRLRAAQQENFLAVADLEKRTITQLGSREVPQVLQTDEGNGNTFVGVTDFGKRIESQWQGSTRKDIYAIDVSTGEKKLVKENLNGQVYPSSTGRYIAWYDRKAKHYFAWDGAATRNITAGIKMPLYQEDWDTPEEPANYGVMGWHEGDSALYVYDKFDIWQVSPAGVFAPINYTASVGRSMNETFRYVRTDPEERFFKNSQTVYYRTQNDVTKSAALFKTSLVQNRVTHFLLGEYGGFSIGQPVKARNDDKLIFTKENFQNPPDLYVWTGNENYVNGQRVVEKGVRLSAINPQQKEYNWGTAELFTWKAYNGKPATGIVYKPEDFDPRKKYPMIVYFYEKLSDGLHSYKEPAPIRSAVNVPFFVSRGYIIFMPDIEYRTGYPGKSAYDYIVSGTRALVKKGWVDSTNMALQGHSWGGYQAAQVATMTKLYKAVWAGAPVANMTSAYGGIRWESGVNRQFQYEKTQSRIGATLWEKLPLYLENSPLFHLDKVTSPMVIMANDADGAVPWYQGIELFTGLRRLGKKVWMFNYNGQGHGLTQRQDMRDYQIRMQQFFDWILKGDKPAKWITEGLPAVKKGREWGLEVE